MIHLLVRKIVLNFLLKLSYLKFDFTVTLGYFKPASKNPDPIVWGKIAYFTFSLLSHLYEWVSADCWVSPEG